ncbi:MAG: hypothetical protein M3480_04625, partial [Verrucomicrobiota bacterium]|nr:hypothetical protein [Verrucomicrobiota bacterium]
LAYMILGASIPNQNGMTGGLIHLVNHSFSKITLFFAAGSILLASHKTKISELAGLGRFLPWTFAALTIGSLSIIGIPPAAGFVTKYFLAIGSIQADWLVVFFVLLVSTLLSAAYYLRVIRTAFFGAPQENVSHPISEISYFIIAPMILTAAISILLGILPTLLLPLVRLALR